MTARRKSGKKKKVPTPKGELTPYMRMRGGLSGRRPKPKPDERRKGAPWPLNPEATFAVTCVDWPDYLVEVEIAYDGLGMPVATGVSVRRMVPTKPTSRSWSELAWPEGTKPVPVSTREMKRLPLERMVDAVLVTCRRLEEATPDRVNDVAALLNAKTRPTKQHKADFYKKIADVARFYIEHPELGRSPAKEIARRTGVSENLAHQWIYKARKLGFLEPSQRGSLRSHHATE